MVKIQQQPEVHDKHLFVMWFHPETSNSLIWRFEKNMI